MDKYLTIGKLSKVSGASCRTIRHYDNIGLLKCSKISDTKYRLYSEEDVKKLEKILLFKSLGFGLDEIGIILNSDDSNKVSEIFSRKLNKLDREMAIISEQKTLINAINRTYHNNGLEYIHNYNHLGEVVFMDNLFLKTFNKLELQLQIKVIKELYDTGSISPATMKEICQGSSVRLLKELHMVVVKMLMNRIDRKVEKNIMEELEVVDNELSEEIKKAMFTFEDIIMLPDATIKKWISNCDEDKLLIALSESGKFVRSRVFNNLEGKKVESIKNKLKEEKSYEIEEVYEARTSLIGVLRKLEMMGEVTIEIHE